MIATLEIKGFKSIRQARLDCRRINLFIGEPNTGKSNILEALGFLSFCGHGGVLTKFVRLEKTQDLFYDGLLDADGWNLSVTGSLSVQVIAQHQKGGYEFRVSGPFPAFFGLPYVVPDEVRVPAEPPLSFIKFYRYERISAGTTEGPGPLRPPNGSNIVALLFSSRKLRELAGNYFAPYGLKLVIRPHEHKLEVQKESEGVAIGFPFDLTSETLQRMVFYTVAIGSNKGATLVFEEPEAHAFPYFTKHLGERIALDENANQYFIATHNPYLLTAIVEKAPKGEVAVFATYYRDYETRVKLLGEAELVRLFEADPFLSIEQVIEDEA